MVRKHPIHIKISTVLGLLFLVIVILTFFIYYSINTKVTPRLIAIAESSIHKLNETIFMQYQVKNIYNKLQLEDVIILNKNANDEILTVDFKLENAYAALSLITSYLKENLESNEARNQILKYYDEDLSTRLGSIILSIPLGVSSNNIFLANLGPRIPVQVKYMDYLATSIRIKLQDYGINNVLVSMYIDCSLTNEILVPHSEKEIEHTYSILIASKIIQGTVPDYYGGSLETKSNILNIPME